MLLVLVYCHVQGRRPAGAERAAEDHEDEAGQQQQALQNGHALLEDDFLRKDVETAGQRDHLPGGLLPLCLERDHGALPDLVVLRAD
jgi:hypothetical protein